MSLERAVPPNPYDFMVQVPPLTLESSEFTDGATLSDQQVAAFGNTSPALSWSTPPAGTQSLAITCFDPDAPTVSGFWHWVVVDLPPELQALAAGDDQPAQGLALKHDGGGLGYFGAAPPAGDRAHRYIFAVVALDVPNLGITAETSPAVAHFSMLGHVLGRGTLTGYYATPPAS